jgi:hypothetical protein
MRKKEVKQGIVVLDYGIENASLIGPESYCCWNAFIPYRF